MPYRSELNFITSVFTKSNLDSFIIDESSKDKNNNNNTFLDSRSFFRRNLPFLKEKHLYKYTDNYMLSYRFFLLPDGKNKKGFFIGPYLNEEFSPQQILKIGEENEVPPHQHKFLLEFYEGLPVLLENSPLLIMLNTFFEVVYKTTSFIISDFVSNDENSDTPFSKSLLNTEPSNELIKKEAIERRYEFENKLIRAVSLGQLHIESQFNSTFSNEIFEKRASDPLQNAKNYCIIMNTLLRKGAEQGGVHPVYLNQVSTDYALKIENTSSSQVIPDLMKEMFRSYCRLVRKHKIRQYSPVVQKTILTIDADLSNDLSLKTLANNLNISSGYLSAVFKKETGTTLSEYVCIRRMDYAEYLLNTTNLQIQTIALHSGIMDVQYFSKLFKRYKGKNPSSYRKK